MALDTVQDYIDQARVLLLDNAIAPYRYPDADIVAALNMGLMETRRIRPELVKNYFRSTIPSFTTSGLTDAVPYDVQYRTALLYYICGHCQMRDDENNEDSRAAAFKNKFVSQLLTIAS